MKKFLPLSTLAFVLVFSVGCKNSKAEQKSRERNKEAAVDSVAAKKLLESSHKNKPSDFLPEGYVVFEELHGDLNYDGLKDCILIIKGTDKNNIVTDEYRGKLDRNRRGIIVLFKTDTDKYQLAVENKDCFSSENEDGGVYYAPELAVSVEKNNLYIHYAHGRYGYWTYTFSYRNSDFQLIGYDSSENSGPVINRETSINYLTGKKQVRINTNDEAESGDEVFEEKWSEIQMKDPVQLSRIKDFDALEVD